MANKQERTIYRTAQMPAVEAPAKKLPAAPASARKIPAAPVKSAGIYRVFNIVFAVLFIATLVLAIVFNPGAVLSTRWYWLLLSAVLGMALALGASRLFMLIKTPEKRGEVVTVAALMLVLAALQVFFGVMLRVQPVDTGNFGLVYNYAADYATTGAVPDEYFLYNPTHSGLYVVLTGFFSLLGLFGVSDFVIPALVLNILAVDGAVLMLYFCGRRLFGQRKAIFLLVLCIFCLPLYLFIPIFYTATFSMPVVVGILLLWLRTRAAWRGGDEKKAWVQFLILSAVAGVGALIKTTVLILWIAAALDFIILLAGKGRWKVILSGLGIVAVLYAGGFFGLRYLPILPEYDPEDTFPVSGWVLMGVQGNGGFSEEIYEDILEQEPDARSAYASYELGNAFSDPLGVLEQVGRKIAYTYGDGTYEAPLELDRSPIQWSFLHDYVLPYGASFAVFYCVAFGLHAAMLGWMVVAAVKAFRRRNNALTFARVALFGLWLFLLLWKTGPGELVNFIPLFLLCALEASPMPKPSRVPRRREHVPAAPVVTAEPDAGPVAVEDEAAMRVDDEAALVEGEAALPVDGIVEPVAVMEDEVILPVADVPEIVEGEAAMPVDETVEPTAVMEEEVILPVADMPEMAEDEAAMPVDGIVEPVAVMEEEVILPVADVPEMAEDEAALPVDETVEPTAVNVQYTQAEPEQPVAESFGYQPYEPPAESLPEINYADYIQAMPEEIYELQGEDAADELEPEATAPVTDLGLETQILPIEVGDGADWMLAEEPVEAEAVSAVAEPLNTEAFEAVSPVVETPDMEGVPGGEIGDAPVAAEVVPEGSGAVVSVEAEGQPAAFEPAVGEEPVAGPDDDFAEFSQWLEAGTPPVQQAEDVPAVPVEPGAPELSAETAEPVEALATETVEPEASAEIAEPVDVLAAMPVEPEEIAEVAEEPVFVPEVPEMDFVQPVGYARPMELVGQLEPEDEWAAMLPDAGVTPEQAGAPEAQPDYILPDWQPVSGVYDGNMQQEAAPVANVPYQYAPTEYTPDIAPQWQPLDNVEDEELAPAQQPLYSTPAYGQPVVQTATEPVPQPEYEAEVPVAGGAQEDAQPEPEYEASAAETEPPVYELSVESEPEIVAEGEPEPLVEVQPVAEPEYVAGPEIGAIEPEPEVGLEYAPEPVSELEPVESVGPSQPVAGPQLEVESVATLTPHEDWSTLEVRDEFQVGDGLAGEVEVWNASTGAAGWTPEDGQQMWPPAIPGLFEPTPVPTTVEHMQPQPEVFDQPAIPQEDMWPSPQFPPAAPEEKAGPPVPLEDDDDEKSLWDFI